MNARDPIDARGLVEALSEAGQTVSVAESCTGGLLGGAITSVAGSSEVFWGGAISYDDDAKVDLLAVGEESLERHGAVSREVAIEMAAGLRSRAQTTWAVSVTGIAGPDGGSSEKPVGTVWLAIDGPVSTQERCLFEGDRDEVREATVERAIDLLYSCVSGDARAISERTER